VTNKHKHTHTHKESEKQKEEKIKWTRRQCQRNAQIGKRRYRKADTEVETDTKLRDRVNE
jgi:hypothetical protein